MKHGLFRRVYGYLFVLLALITLLMELAKAKP